MPVGRRLLVFLVTPLSACSTGLAAPRMPAGSIAELAPRPPPPIATSNCAGLSQEELRKAGEYLSKLTWVEPKYRDDAAARTHFQGLSENPSLLIGVNLYVPAEYGISRAYLERLLSCHAVQPSRFDDHPNDPLLAPGIASVDVEDVDGGQYRVSISAQSRVEGEKLLQRARAVRVSPGTVTVQQVEASAP